jgi:non-ribosomal peptide synthase protein (TIGR01720 family)
MGHAGSGALLVDLEGHGREVGDSGLDLTRTVGWFTSVYPVRLDLEGLDLQQALGSGAAMGQAIGRIKESLRRTPDRGIGYGMLRWLNESTKQDLMALPQAQIAFNYLGRFERSDSGAQGWGLLDQVLVGGQDDPNRRRFHLIDVNSAVDGSGALCIDWGYHPKAHEAQAIEDLAQRFGQALEALTAHCLHTPLAQRWTPSDFSLAQQAGLDQALLDELARCDGFEQVLPLAPLQQGLAYESWSQGEQRQADPYHVQLAVQLGGELDLERLKLSLEQLVRRHRVLRLSLPLQAVERGLGVYSHRALDWSVQDAEGRTLEEILQQEHAQAFDLAQGPLLRTWVIVHDARHHTLLMSNHHALLDGWSTPILMGELGALYRGETLQATVDWQLHLQWLASSDRAQAQRYWQSHFEGMEPGAALQLPEPEQPESGMGECEVQLPAVLMRMLDEFARRHGLTQSTVYEGAFMLMLARQSGQGEITVGVTRSGRSAQRAVV